MFNGLLKKIYLGIYAVVNSLKQQEQALVLIGGMAANNLKGKKFANIREAEFKVFSQFGDDGIIQYLIQNIKIPSKTFCEFGVEDYLESNTRFLLINNSWEGLILDGSKKNIKKIQSFEYYWKYNIEARAAFIDAHNINGILHEKFSDKELGILHIDIDGVDYWIWEAIDINPCIVIVEYNSIFGEQDAVTVPYDPSFSRINQHFSSLYFGASIQAFNLLAISKGYSLVGGNSAGNNLYFVRNDLLNDVIVPCAIHDAYALQSFTEERDNKGVHTYRRNADAYRSIIGLPVYDLIKKNLRNLI